MRKIDIPLQVDHLRQLGDSFTAQQRAVQDLKPEPGTELLRQLAPAIPAVHELITRSLTRLAVLDGSQYTAAPGARAALYAVGSLVADASNAATGLANAVAANPLDATGFPGGPPTDGTAPGQARHDEARPVIAHSLADAAFWLEVCAATCHHAATGILQDLVQHPEHRPPLPKLTDAQYAALDKIAQGGASRYSSIRGTAVRITAADGATINAKPFGVLEQHRLVRTEHTSAISGQRITVTAAGRLALKVHKPGRTRPASPSATPSQTEKGTRRR